MAHESPVPVESEDAPRTTRPLVIWLRRALFLVIGLLLVIWTLPRMVAMTSLRDQAGSLGRTGAAARPDCRTGDVRVA